MFKNLKIGVRLGIGFAITLALLVAVSAIGVARVDDLQAQLNIAQFELDNTVVRAPSRGYVTQVMLCPGIYAVKMPLRPAMVFVPHEDYAYVAWMRQNSQLRLTMGDDAEIAFDGLPGQVFKARVKMVLPVIAEGQLQPSGNLMGFTGSPPPGRVPVVLEVTDPAFEPYRDLLPGGSYGQAALYTEHFHHVAVMRKILLRMSSWMNYFFPFHQPARPRPLTVSHAVGGGAVVWRGYLPAAITGLWCGSFDGHQCTRGRSGHTDENCHGVCHEHFRPARRPRSTVR